MAVLTQAVSTILADLPTAKCKRMASIARHGLVKWFGVCLAVASGLAVGPEGPMIFIGGSLGKTKSLFDKGPVVSSNRC